MGGFGYDGFVFAGIGRVELEVSRMWEVELALDGASSVGTEIKIQYLGLFVVF